MCGRKTLSKDITSIIEEMKIEEWEGSKLQAKLQYCPYKLFARHH